MFYCIIGRIGLKHGSGKTLRSLMRWLKLMLLFTNGIGVVNIKLKNLPEAIMKRTTRIRLFEELEAIVKKYEDSGIPIIVLLDEALKFFYREDTTTKIHKARKKDFIPFLRKSLVFMVFNIPSLGQLEQYMYDVSKTVEMPTVYVDNSMKVEELKSNTSTTIPNVSYFYNKYDSYEKEFVTHAQELKYIYEIMLPKDKMFLEMIQHKATKPALVNHIKNTYNFGKEDSTEIYEKYCIFGGTLNNE